LLGEHRRESPVVEDEELDASEALEKARMLTVAACERQCIEEPWQTPIDDRSVIAASLVAERTGNPTLAGSGRSSDILPGIRTRAGGFIIRFTRGVGTPWLSFGVSVSKAETCSSSINSMGRWRIFHAG